MYEIKLKVNGNGTISTGSLERLRLGTECEVNRAKFIFDIDSTVEGTYQYIKFKKGDSSYLYRVTNKVAIINKTILAHPGIWYMSFISTTAGIANGEITGTYAFITEPIETVVYKGIINKDNNYKNAEAELLSKLITMDFTSLIIPDDISKIGDYFLYNSNMAFSVHIPNDVKTIGAYTFYKATITNLTFGDNPGLTTLEERALNNITFNCDVVLPKSIYSWGKNSFKGSSGAVLKFESDSKLGTLGSYALWENKFKKIYLPDKLYQLGGGNTYTIKNCKSLTYLWIPNTIRYTIDVSTIYGCSNLTNIELQTGFNASCNFSNCTALTKTSIVAMFNALKNLKGSTAKSITLGSTNLAKLTEEEISIATNKNWTVS